jgi:hypothetical protein
MMNPVIVNSSTDIMIACFFKYSYYTKEEYLVIRNI